MRIAFGAGLVAFGFLLAGCSIFHHKHAAGPAPTPLDQPPALQMQQTGKPVIKPDLRSTGQVAMVNADARFVVITFDTGAVPAAGRRLNVYRAGQKVGEVTVTGPQHENDTVADIVSGDIQLHDEARAE